MNEQIKALAQQAGESIPEFHFGDWNIPNEFIQKFAELIVKECCQYLHNEAERLFGLSESEEDPVFQSNFEICAEKCYDNIQGLKEHFGVE